MLRSIILAPGNDESAIDAAISSGADCVVLDLEDTVSSREKDEARDQIKRYLDQSPGGRMDIGIRINSLDQGGINDLELAAHDCVDRIVIPKVQSQRNAWHISDIYKRYEVEKDVSPGSVLAVIETALGVANSDEIATAHEKIDSISLGLNDLREDADLEPTDDRTEIIFARSKIANSATLAKIQAIDFATPSEDGQDQVRKDAEMARSMGYTGKGAVNIDHLKVIHDTFGARY